MCTAVGPAGTSIDCPPTSSTFLAVLNVVVPQLTSGTSSLSAGDGLFCDGQTMPGAIGLADARTVTENGAGPTLSGTSLQMNLAGAFCIAPTGTFLDGIASLPGVGALSAVGQVNLTGLLP